MLVKKKLAVLKPNKKTKKNKSFYANKAAMTLASKG